MASQLKPVPSDESPFLTGYQPFERRRVRHDGWTAERQREFLTVLAETGSVSQACRDAGVSSRSAYRLRQHPDAAAFAAAWDQALRLAVLRLTSIAYERAINGTVREYWRNGELVAETRTPSDRLMVFLLGHLLPRGDKPSRMDGFDQAVAEARDGFPAALDRLVDHDMPMVPLESRDFFASAPGYREEDG